MTDPDAESEGRRALTVLVAAARRLAAAERLEDAAGPASPRGSLRDDGLLSAVAETAAVVLEARAASIALHDPATDRLVFSAAAGPAAGDVVGLAIDASAGIAGYAFSTGQPLAVADASQDPRFDRTVAEATGYVPHSLLATPLVDEQGVVGILEVLDRRTGTFDLHDLDVAGALAREATIIVRRGRTARDAGRLLRAALAAAFAEPGDPSGPASVVDPLAIETLVSVASERLAADDDDPTWRLADRLGRLVATDADRLDLAVDWLDALLRHADERSARTGRPGR